MIDAGLAMGLILVLSVGTNAYLFLKRRKLTTEGTLAAEIERISTQISDLATTSEQPKTVDSDVMERLEAVERRMEVVHSDALKYLQKAAAAEQRMKSAGEADEEEVLSEEEARKYLDAEQPETTQGIRPYTLEELEAIAERS